MLKPSLEDKDRGGTDLFKIIFIRKVKILRRNTSIVSSRVFLAFPRRFPVSRPPRQFCCKIAAVVASSESKFGESIHTGSCDLFQC